MTKVTTILGGLVLALGLAAGCKKQSRESMCKDGQSAFDRGMASALEGRTAGMAPEQKKFVDDKIATAKRNFMKFCMELSDSDIKCLSKQDVTSPSCANVMKLVQTKLLEM